MEKNYRKLFFELIEQGKLQPTYFEDEDGNDGVDLGMDNEVKAFFDMDPEIMKDFHEYLQECYVVAIISGFESPNNYYKAIQAYLESEGDGAL